jgi:uncharacterized membrane protein
MSQLDSQKLSQPLPKPRYVYIDLLRGWAVLVMIETHVTNTFLIPAIRFQPWFGVLNFINGIVAPSFLFVAGYSFAIVGQRKWNDYLSLNGVFWKQVGRILQIWAVGYALHLPFFSFNKLAFLIGWDEWISFWPVDVLQCIAVSLVLMLLLVVIARSHRVFLVLLCVAGCVVAFASPFMSTMNLDDMLSLPFSNYINSLHGSLFPIFPWMSFVLFGGAAGELFAFLKAKMPEGKVFKGIFAAGIALVALSIIANLQPMKVFPPHDFWTTSPEFFFIRLGALVLGTRCSFRKVDCQPSWLGIVSDIHGTSADHLRIIYQRGQPGNHRRGNTFDSRSCRDDNASHRGDGGDCICLEFIEEKEYVVCAGAAVFDSRRSPARLFYETVLNNEY